LPREYWLSSLRDVKVEKSDMYLELSRIGCYIMMTKRRGYAIWSAVARVNEHLRQTLVLGTTSLGDITIDLLVDDAPKCCEK
jgi:hypothetical protein